ncbi:MAG: methyltransferase family protein [Promethearchaeota archaeon]
MLKIFNLWFFYLIGYIFALFLQEWANRKRGQPFDDPEFLFGNKIIVPIAMLWLFSGFGISLFIEVNFDVLFFIGLIFYITGLIIGAIALYSFAHNTGLTTTRIHQYSRNPIYVSWIVFYFGLTLMGWSSSIWSILFLVYFIITFPYFHWTVLLEEKFLVTKFGHNYETYLKETPRYFGKRRLNHNG